MKTFGLVIAFVIVSTAALTQGVQMPTTINLIDNKTGEKLGTATTMQGSGVFYLRDNKGRFIATVIKGNGKVELFDESGKPLAQIPNNITLPEVQP